MERKAFQIRTALGGSLERPQGGTLSQYKMLRKEDAIGERADGDLHSV